MSNTPTTPDHDDGDPSVVDDFFISPEEGRRMFDEAVRDVMGLSGEEFINRWKAGEYWEVADRAGYRHIGNLIGLIGFADPDSWASAVELQQRMTKAATEVGDGASN